MPTLAYLNSGQSITAAGMNALFAELDRKAWLALDGHSILYLLQTDATVARRYFEPFIGPTFHFVQGSQPISGYWGTWSYDHSVFQNAVAASVIYTGSSTNVADTTNKYVRINPLPASYFTQIGKVKHSGSVIQDWRRTMTLLRWSLEAHRRAYTPPEGEEEQYWIGETFNAASDISGSGALPVWLERIRTLQQAELIFEGGVTELDFLGAWNKYNFFRIHACQAQAVTVRFRNSTGGIAHTVTVGGYGSQCVRRTGVDGTYTDGFHYFQRFVSGDRRFYQHPNCNNVVNPSLLIPFVNRLLAGRRFDDEFTGEFDRQFAAPTVMLDPQVRAPLPSGYGYGDPSVSTTKLGDLLHHPGEVVHVDSSADPNAPTITRFTFNGYGSLVSLNGVSAQASGDDYQIKASGSGTHDFMCLSTNLFCTGETAFINAPVRDASDWITLDRHMPEFAFVTEIVSTSVDHTVSYNLINGTTTGAAVPQTITRTTRRMAEQYPASGLLPHVTTAGETVDRVASSAALCSFASTTMALTSSGLVLNTTQTIPLAAPFSGTPDPVILDPANPDTALNNYLASPIVPVIAPDLLHHISCDGENIIIKRSLVFTGYGFPDTDDWFYTGFLTPRFTRIYSDRPFVGGVAGSHPNFHEGYKNANGQEVVCTGVRGSGHLSTEIKILSPWNSRNDTFNSDAGDVGRTDVVGTMSNNDVLYGATKNASVPGYWAGNRSRLLENRIFYSSTQDGSDITHALGDNTALQYYRFIRMRMEVEHYNNLAAKVNSMARYRPLNGTDHGVIQNGSDQTLRHRLTPNRFGIWEAAQTTAYWASISLNDQRLHSMRFHQQPGLRPSDQFFASTSLAAASISAAGYAGIPVYGIADLPDGFAAARGSKDLEVDVRINPDVIADPRESTFRFVRPEMNGITDYYWLSVDDVQAHWEGLGYKFIHADIGAGMALGVFETSPNLVAKFSNFQAHPTNLAQYETLLLRQVEFYPTDGPGSWIVGDGNRALQVQEMDWADTCYFSILRGGTTWRMTYSGSYPEPMRRVFWNNPNRTNNIPVVAFGYTARNPGGKFYGDIPITNDIICREPFVQKFLSAGVPDASLVVEIDVPYFRFTPNFSEGGLNQKIANGGAQDGRFYPFTAQSSGASRPVLFADFTAPFDA